jgi:ribonuclease Z
MDPRRRHIWMSALAGWLVSAWPIEARAQASEGGDDFRVTLLGTGSPQPVIDRFGPSVLIQVAGQSLLFDCGRGVTQRLNQLHVRLGDANKLFLTHLHSDHTVGIPDLLLTGWLDPPWGQRKGPLQVFGPAGTRNLMEHLELAYSWDIDTRVADQKLARENVAVAVTEFTQGVVYEHDKVKVTAFEVDHGDQVKPAFGFRVDYDGRAVVISGDTRFSANLIKHAEGVDLLIHQVAAVRPELLASAVFRAILAHHTKPEEAGVVFSRVRPKLAVFYHFSLLGTSAVPPLTVQEVVAATRKTYGGPLVAGEDLMAFCVGAGGVSIAPAYEPVSSALPFGRRTAADAMDHLRRLAATRRPVVGAPSRPT